MKKAWIYVLLAAILFTTLEPVSKVMANEINPLAITFIRFFIGGLILLPFSITKAKKDRISLKKEDYFYLTLMGVLCICMSMVLLQCAVLKADSPALIAIIFSSNSVFTILLSSVILKDKITLEKSLAIVLCMAGVLIGTDFSSGNNLLSVGLAVLAALTFSLYTVLSKRYMKKMSGIIQTGYSFFFGSIILLVVLLIMKVEIVGSAMINNIVPLLYLTVAVTGMGYLFYFKAIENSSVLSASLVFFIKPVLTPFATFFINGIVPNGKVFIALALVISGSLVSSIHIKNKRKLIVR